MSNMSTMYDLNTNTIFNKPIQKLISKQNISKEVIEAFEYFQNVPSKLFIGRICHKLEILCPRYIIEITNVLPELIAKRKLDPNCFENQDMNKQADVIAQFLYENTTKLFRKYYYCAGIYSDNLTRDELCDVIFQIFDLYSKT